MTWLVLPDGIAFGDTLLDIWFDTHAKAATWVMADGARG